MLDCKSQPAACISPHVHTPQPCREDRAQKRVLHFSFTKTDKSPYLARKYARKREEGGGENPTEEVRKRVLQTLQAVRADKVIADLQVKAPPANRAAPAA